MTGVMIGVTITSLTAIAIEPGSVHPAMAVVQAHLVLAIIPTVATLHVIMLAAAVEEILVGTVVDTVETEEVIVVSGEAVEAVEAAEDVEVEVAPMVNSHKLSPRSHYQRYPAKRML